MLVLLATANCGDGTPRVATGEYRLLLAVDSGWFPWRTHELYLEPDGSYRGYVRPQEEQENWDWETVWCESALTEADADRLANAVNGAHLFDPSDSPPCIDCGAAEIAVQITRGERAGAVAHIRVNISGEDEGINGLLAVTTDIAGACSAP